MSDPIIRLNAALSGRYEIERELGEGGMATVYLARDLKHNRNVALKVLKPELAAVVGAERFLAEIETTANLQHPHILPLFDSGEVDGFLFYVMPFIEGETLRDRLEREKQLPVEDAVRIAHDVAEALHSAHEQGVIHRDIKPANILMSGGRPLVADFGIALAVSAAGGGRLTETGLSMGTPFYMSPEQASADREPSAASDVYSLGCVLYEMLVGEPPYTGGSGQAVLAKILMGDAPAPNATRASIPGHVDAAIRKALEKLPADRFAGAQDFSKALADPGFRHGERAVTGGGVGAGPWKWVSVVGWGVAAIATLAFGWTLRSSESRPVARFELTFAEGVGVPPPVVSETLALSPDGSRLVFMGPGSTEVGQLWQRALDDLEPRPLPGTEGAANPRVSPDGRWVVFAAERELRTVSLAGGPPLSVVPLAARSGSSAWGPDEMIYFQREDAIHRVPATGGEPEAFASPTEGARHTSPDVLPDGRGLLLTVDRGDPSLRRIAVVGPEGGEVREILTGTMARYAASGHVVYSTVERTLMAAPFDPKRLEVTGPAVMLLEDLALRFGIAPQFALSQTGTLVYRTGGPALGQLEFVWMTRSGQTSPVDPGYSFTPSIYSTFSLSPDETRVAFNAAVDGGDDDIWIKNLSDGPEERITFSAARERGAVWMPAGQRVTYFSDGDVWSRRADGTGEPVLLLDDDHNLTNGSWSPDGESLVLRVGADPSQRGQRDITVFRLGVDSAAIPLLASPEFAEGSPALSPDGRWIAYNTDETGRQEVFVRPFPDVDSARIRVSSDGGMGPVWAKNGRELFFVDAGRTLVAAPFDPSSGGVSSPEPLFVLPAGYTLPTGGIQVFDVSRDGERFLMTRRYGGGGDEEVPTRLILVQNFFEELRRLAPN